MWWKDPLSARKGGLGRREPVEGERAGSLAGPAGGAVWELPPFEPLEELALTVEERPELLAASRRDLKELRSSLPEEYSARWEEIDSLLTSKLFRAVTELRAGVGRELDRELEARDYAAAHETFHVEFPERLRRVSGYRPSELAGQGIGIQTWLEDKENRILDAANDAAQQVEKRLDQWLTQRTERFWQRLEHQAWRSAQELLAVEDPLEELGFADLTLPQAQHAELIERARLPTVLLRGDLQDRWEALDRELVQKIRRRQRFLMGELERGRPRPRAARGLREFFELELSEKRLDPKEFPELSAAFMGVLEESEQALAEREQELLKADALEDYAEAERTVRALLARPPL